MQRRLTTWLAITLASASLTACGGPTVRQPPPPKLEAVLAPTQVEGPHRSLDELMADPASSTADVLRYAGNSEDAVLSCNADKARAAVLVAPPPAAPRCPWWRWRCQ